MIAPAIIRSITPRTCHWPGPAARTGKHYDQDERIDEKREALRRLADEIRRIVDAPVQAESVDLEQRLAA
jgi:hypothetical protein